jgi:hypothetical protein
MRTHKLLKICVQFRAKGFEARGVPLRLFSRPNTSVGRTLAEVDQLIRIPVHEIDFRTQVGCDHRNSPLQLASLLFLLLRPTACGLYFRTCA